MVELGGRQAVRFTTETIDQSVCGEEAFCAVFATNNLVHNWFLEPGTTSTIYWVDTGDVEPLAVIVGSPSTNDEWIDTAEAMLATLEFGEPGPHPIDADAGPLWEQGISFDVPAGVQRFPSFGGIQIDLPEGRFVIQEGPNIMRIFPDGEIPAVVEVVRADAGTDGTSIASADDFVAVMEGLVGSVEEVGSGTYPLGEAREISVSGGSQGLSPDTPGIYTYGETVPWFAPPTGRLWVFETDRGVIVVSAASFGTEADLDQVIELAEAVILPSAEFESSRE